MISPRSNADTPMRDTLPDIGYLTEEFSPEFWNPVKPVESVSPDTDEAEPFDEFVESFRNRITAGWTLTSFTVILESKFGVPKVLSSYEKRPLAAEYSSILFRLDSDSELVTRELLGWLNQGYAPIGLFQSGGMWFTVAGRVSQTREFIVVRSSEFDVVRHSLRTYSDMGVLLKHMVSDGTVWILVFEKVGFPFTWVWDTRDDYYSMDQTMNAMVSNYNMSFLAPVMYQQKWYTFGFRPMLQ